MGRFQTWIALGSRYFDIEAKISLAVLVQIKGLGLSLHSFIYFVIPLLSSFSPWWILRCRDVGVRA